jgi:hypothetical protein
MIIQISIASSILPISSAFIYNIVELGKLIYAMGGLLLLSQIDNFAAELLTIQLEKNHADVLKHEKYMQFETCQTDIDSAYWWVITMILHNQINVFGFYFVNKFENCPNVDAYFLALEGP